MSLLRAIILFALLWLAYQLGRFCLGLIVIRSRFQRMQKDGLVRCTIHTRPMVIYPFQYTCAKTNHI